MKINRVILAISVITILFGSVALSSALGLWSTESSKIPVKYKDGEYAGEYNPVDIRGSYTFDNISNLFNIPLNDLATAFAVPDNQPKADFLCKHLEELYAESASIGKEVGTNSVRVFVALYKGLPIELDDNTYFPKPAKQVLLNNVSLTEAEISYISNHLVDISENEIINNDSDTNNDEAKKVVTGKTTFKDIFAKGISIEDLDDIISVKILNEDQSIRDYCIENELNFSEVKAKIEYLLQSN